MGDDLLENLNTYNEQLKQVEAALTNTPDDAELLQLKRDLLEVLKLTTELIDSQTPAASAAASITGNVNQGPTRLWRQGDRCMAPCTDDFQYYEATVDEVTSEGDVLVSFVSYPGTHVTKLSLLKECDTAVANADSADETDGDASGSKAARQEEDGDPASKTFNKRSNRDQQEYLKKRKLKKQQRFKELEESREQEKSRWQHFHCKAKKGRGMRGVTKSSIFKTPDAVRGRVGVGTCNKGGRPMTSYSGADKWKRGM